MWIEGGVLELCVNHILALTMCESMLCAPACLIYYCAGLLVVFMCIVYNNMINHYSNPCLLSHKPLIGYEPQALCRITMIVMMYLVQFP